ITTISGVRLQYKPIAETEYGNLAGDWNKVSTLKLPHNENHITFDFLAINFSNPDAVRYQWKLEGADKDWSPALPQKTTTYQNLSAGNYTFMVKACNEDGV